MGMGVLSNELGIATLSSIIDSVDSFASSPFEWKRRNRSLASKLPKMCSDLIETPKKGLDASFRPWQQFGPFATTRTFFWDF